MNSNKNSYVDRLRFYQAANNDPESLKAGFVVRLTEYELIMSRLKAKTKEDTFQHELIIGRRGSGKSTLLKRIELGILDQPNFSNKYLPINFPEEQATIYRLSDLWFETYKELARKLDENISLKDFTAFEDDNAYTKYVFSELSLLIKESGVNPVLLLDNFDKILGSLNDNGNLLREQLHNFNNVKIIGASTRMDEHFWNYKLPFYDYFRVHRLGPLSVAEIDKLLNYWAEIMDLPILSNYVQNNRGRIESIRLLTDGLPRTLQFFIRILISEDLCYGFDYIQKIMDLVTPIYQDRLNALTPPQRKIVAELAFLWESSSTKDLVVKCRMESKLISAHLRTLLGFGIVEKIETGTKNHLYRISERFFNMWYIITQGNPHQKRKAKYLSLFLEKWYDENDIKDLAQDHLSELAEGIVPYGNAVLKSKALSQSRYVSVDMRDELIKGTRALNKESFVVDDLPEEMSVILDQVEKLCHEEEYDLAIEKLLTIENEADGVKEWGLGIVLEKAGRISKAVEYYKLAIAKGDVKAIFNLALCYEREGKENEAKKYYKKAIDKGDVNAIFNLAMLYEHKEQVKEAEEYFKLAIGKGDVNAINNLAVLYDKGGKGKEAEEYYKLAIKKGDVDAIFNLALFYKDKGKGNEVKKYYKLAMEKGHVNAINNLGVLYAKAGKEEEAEECYKLAIEKGHVKSMYNLAVIYARQGKGKEAKKYYKLAIKKGHVSAMFNLALLYEGEGKEKEAEVHYKHAIENGDLKSLNNLGLLYRSQGRTKESETYLRMAIEEDVSFSNYALAQNFFEENRNGIEALDLINNQKDVESDSEVLALSLLIEIWNNKFENIDSKVERILDESNCENLDSFILGLLSLGQGSLVLSMFDSEKHGVTLKDKYVILYYAVALINDTKNKIIELKIPEEIKATVQEVISKVKSKKAFYA